MVTRHTRAMLHQQPEQQQRFDFFERQNERDCTIHSLNNASGRVVVTKKQVLEKIDRMVADFAKTHDDPAQVEKYKKQLTVKNSFFSAETVWDTAIELGTVASMSPVPGFGGDFADLDHLPSWIIKAHLVFLGLDAKGHPHAVGARDGRIYDSQRWRAGPLPLDNKNLGFVLSRVFALFVVNLPGSVPISSVTRIKPESIRTR